MDVCMNERMDGSKEKNKLHMELIGYLLYMGGGEAKQKFMVFRKCNGLLVSYLVLGGSDIRLGCESRHLCFEIYVMKYFHQIL